MHTLCNTDEEGSYMPFDDPLKDLVSASSAYRNLMPQMPDLSKIPLRNIPKESAEWTAIMMRQMVAQQGENLVAVILAKVKALEANLQAGEALVVYCDAGKERIRVERFEFPNWHLAIVSGLDEEDNRAYRIENVQDIKLTCKIVKGLPKKNSIGFVLPKEPETAK
jgi:hypothetical protein